MTPINSSLEFAVNPATGLLPSGQSPLNSLIPTLQLQRPATPQPLNPYGQIPAASTLTPLQPDQNWLANLNHEFNVVNTAYPSADLNPTQMPQWNQYEPIESLQALRNYIAPQIAQQAQKGEAARGIYSSGINPAGSAMAYLNQTIPGMTAPAAQLSDIEYLYGPGVAHDVAMNYGGKFQQKPGGGATATVPYNYFPNTPVPPIGGATPDITPILQNNNNPNELMAVDIVNGQVYPLPGIYGQTGNLPQLWGQRHI